MKEHENPEWKKKVSMQDLVLPGSVEILEAAKTEMQDCCGRRDDKLFLRMIFEIFLKIIKRNGAATPGHLRIPETYEMARELADYIENLGIEEWK